MNEFETNDFFKNHSHLDSKRKRAVPIQLYIFKFVVSILCSSIAFTGNFNDQKGGSLLPLTE